jgi:RNA polymerase sigma-70 factor (ECF subfamily)
VATLQERLAANPDGAFEDVVLEYQDALYRFALRLTNCPQEAEDAAQDAFVRAYSWGAGGRPYPDQLGPWLYRIALNVVRNRVRRKRHPVTALEHASEVAAADPSPPLLVEQGETRAELAGRLAALPLRYREAVVLRHVEELGYDEIASATGRAVGTVKSDVPRGLALLRAAMSPCSGANE